MPPHGRPHTPDGELDWTAIQQELADMDQALLEFSTHISQVIQSFTAYGG